ncbi:amidohydrolase family protein [Kibdelosporangium phytohabitans]|uniref:Amidohydrolase n=1 Tax=Kibdelosporangium phytohabitans TaxID=860235 RepID=A0A0N9I7B2_9PSEU|nr:amidohydrolase family protein [Kibdelosporangium phytohabitans]ALG10390.1 amidohydrolase [Kibdelosporangium phytohabitans]MBE1461450.1 aminocarboxymuconate-semialdehyde decarboxylase [Kibdelosporangium phytohabitans]
MKIDAFCHIMPRPYYDRFLAIEPTIDVVNLRKRVSNIPALVDLNVRFKQMDEFGDYRQIINIAAPPVEFFGSRTVSRELSRIANEAMAELVRSHPDRFAGFSACVPMDDPEAAIEEFSYAVTHLGAVGAQIYTHVAGEAMDAERFDPFYARVADSGLLLQVHPCRSSAWPDYPTEQRSRYEIWWTFGWEYDLSAFMARIVFSGVLERHPALKLLIHHGGSMVPHFAGRVGPGWDQLGARTPESQREDVTGYPLTRRPIDYFKMMYADTALFGAAHALRCSIDFYGTDHVLFASDSPYDPERGSGYIRSTIENLHSIGLDEEEQQAIFSGNISRLLGRDLARR